MGYPKDFTDLSYSKAASGDDVMECPSIHDRDAFAARVQGDSMNPDYQEGEIVIFTPAEAPRNGDDCFVRFGDGDTTFKRVFFEADEKGNAQVRLQPHNPEFECVRVPSSKVTGIWKASFVYRRVNVPE